MSRRRVKLDVFAEITRNVASLSTCEKVAVGCVIVTYDLREIVAIGYNGWPHGLVHHCTIGADPCGCVHAELNACIKLAPRYKDCTCFVNKIPCLRCAQAIIQTQAVSDVIILDSPTEDSFPGINLLTAAGIEVERWV